MFSSLCLVSWRAPVYIDRDGLPPIQDKQMSSLVFKLLAALVGGWTKVAAAKPMMSAIIAKRGRVSSWWLRSYWRYRPWRYGFMTTTSCHPEAVFDEAGKRLPKPGCRGRREREDTLPSAVSAKPSVHLP
jgi:predicted component of type VI protein secretion system